MAEEKSLEEQIMIKAQQARRTARYMGSLEDLVEERIRKAREKGAFDNLKGFGKPLNLYENPFEPADMRMANKILKDAGFAPYWVELGKDIDAEIDAFWEDVEKFKRYVTIVLEGQVSDISRRRFEKRKADFYREVQDRLEKLNKKIDNYNIHNPMFWLGRHNIDIKKEYAKVVEEVEKVVAEILKR